MIMSLKQREIKFKPRIKLNHNIYMPAPCAGKSDTVMLDSKYSMTPKFVKQKSH